MRAFEPQGGRRASEGAPTEGQPWQWSNQAWESRDEAGYVPKDEYDDGYGNGRSDWPADRTASWEGAQEEPEEKPKRRDPQINWKRWKARMKREKERVFDQDIPLRIDSRTLTPRLAHRIGDRLQNYGYVNVIGMGPDMIYKLSRAAVRSRNPQRIWRGRRRLPRREIVLVPNLEKQEDIYSQVWNITVRLQRVPKAKPDDFTFKVLAQEDRFLEIGRKIAGRLKYGEKISLSCIGYKALNNAMKAVVQARRILDPGKWYRFRDHRTIGVKVDRTKTTIVENKGTPEMVKKRRTMFRLNCALVSYLMTPEELGMVPDPNQKIWPPERRRRSEQKDEQSEDTEDKAAIEDWESELQRAKEVVRSKIKRLKDRKKQVKSKAVEAAPAVRDWSSGDWSMSPQMRKRSLTRSTAAAATPPRAARPAPPEVQQKETRRRSADEVPDWLRDEQTLPQELESDS